MILYSSEIDRLKFIDNTVDQNWALSQGRDMQAPPPPSSQEWPYVLNRMKNRFDDFYFSSCG